MHHDYKKPSSIECRYYESPWQQHPKKKRSTYFSPAELDVLLQAYGEYEHIFRKKSNTATAAKEREFAWEKIAAPVNA